MRIARWMEDVRRARGARPVTAIVQLPREEAIRRLQAGLRRERRFTPELQVTGRVTPEGSVRLRRHVGFMPHLMRSDAWFPVLHASVVAQELDRGEGCSVVGVICGRFPVILLVFFAMAATGALLGLAFSGASLVIRHDALAAGMGVLGVGAFLGLTLAGLFVMAATSDHLPRDEGALLSWISACLGMDLP